MQVRLTNKLNAAVQLYGLGVSVRSPAGTEVGTVESHGGLLAGHAVQTRTITPPSGTVRPDSTFQITTVQANPFNPPLCGL